MLSDNHLLAVSNMFVLPSASRLQLSDTEYCAYLFQNCQEGLAFFDAVQGLSSDMYGPCRDGCRIFKREGSNLLGLHAKGGVQGGPALGPMLKADIVGQRGEVQTIGPPPPPPDPLLPS